MRDMEQADTKTAVLQIRLSPALLALVERWAQETGATRGEITRRALAAYLASKLGKVA